MEKLPTTKEIYASVFRDFGSEVRFDPYKEAERSAKDCESSATPEIGLRAEDKTRQQQDAHTTNTLTISFDSCSACGRVMENSLAGLCGRCNPKALRAFINRVREDSAPHEAAHEQLDLTGVRTK